jgi:hypothetical protein
MPSAMDGKGLSPMRRGAKVMPPQPMLQGESENDLRQ